MTLTTLTDVIALQIIPALGEHASDFDVEAIAREAYELTATFDEQGTQRGNAHFVPTTANEDEFWAIVAKHDLTNKNPSGQSEDQ